MDSDDYVLSESIFLGAIKAFYLSRKNGKYEHKN